MKVVVTVWAALLVLTGLLASFVCLSSLWTAGEWMQTGEVPLHLLGVAAKAWVVARVCVGLIQLTQAAVGGSLDDYLRWAWRS